MKRQRWSTKRNRGIAARSCFYLTHDCRTCSVQLTGGTSGNKKETWLKTSTLQEREKRPSSRRQKMEQWGKVESSNKHVWKAEVNERQLRQEQYHRLKDLSQYLREEAGITYQSITGGSEQRSSFAPKSSLHEWNVLLFPLLSPTLCLQWAHTGHCPPLLFPSFSFPSIFPFSFPFTYNLDPCNLTAQPLSQP